MANIAGKYDPNAEASKPFEIIPAGEYLAMIVDSDMKDLNAPKVGRYLELAFEIIDGPQKGRKLWARLNLENASQQAVEIANRDLAAIREAVGVPNPIDSAELHNRPLLIRVDVELAGTKRRNNTVADKDSNNIKGYKRIDGAAPVATTPAAAAATPGSKPWGSKQAA